MLLAKYRALETVTDISRALDIIENRRIYLSPIKAFNDPLEARGVNIPIDGFAGISMSLNSDMLPWPITASLERLRVTCFSANCRSVQMWAHYANNFKGMCICLSGSITSVAKKVDYSDEVNETLYRDYPSSPSDLDERVKTALLVKQKGWEYEKEYRIIQHCDPSDGAMYIPYEPKDLKAVILGQNAEEFVRRVVHDVCKRLGIPLYVTYVRDLSYMVGVCPEEFRLEKDGTPIDEQIRSFCAKHGIKPFEDLEVECFVPSSEPNKQA